MTASIAWPLGPACAWATGAGGAPRLGGVDCVSPGDGVFAAGEAVGPGRNPPSGRETSQPATRASVNRELTAAVKAVRMVVFIFGAPIGVAEPGLVASN